MYIVKYGTGVDLTLEQVRPKIRGPRAPCRYVPRNAVGMVVGTDSLAIPGLGRRLHQFTQFRCDRELVLRKVNRNPTHEVMTLVSL